MRLNASHTSHTHGSDGLRIVTWHGDAMIDCNIPYDELPDFSLMLLEVVDDCLAKLGVEYSVVRKKLDEAISAISPDIVKSV